MFHLFRLMFLIAFFVLGSFFLAWTLNCFGIIVAGNLIGAMAVAKLYPLY